MSYVIEEVPINGLLVAMRRVNHPVHFNLPNWDGKYVARLTNFQNVYANKNENGEFTVFVIAKGKQAMSLNWREVPLPMLEGKTITIYHCDKFERYDIEKGVGGRGKYTIIDSCGRSIINLTPRKKIGQEVYCFSTRRCNNIYFYAKEENYEV